MAKLGFKTVKSYYKVNKHGVGDPTILWPQKFETNFQFNSCPCCIKYFFCVILLLGREGKKNHIKTQSCINVLLFSFTRHFLSHHLIGPLNPCSY